MNEYESLKNLLTTKQEIKDMLSGWNTEDIISKIVLEHKRMNIYEV